MGVSVLRVGDHPFRGKIGNSYGENINCDSGDTVYLEVPIDQEGNCVYLLFTSSEWASINVVKKPEGWDEPLPELPKPILKKYRCPYCTKIVESQNSVSCRHCSWKPIRMLEVK